MTHPAVSGETAVTQTHDPQSGALDAAGLRRVVAVLSTVQIVSWGVLYYAFAALQSSITTDTGWSSVAVTGAFSLAQPAPAERASGSGATSTPTALGG